jgi:hypothetical protein
VIVSGQALVLAFCFLSNACPRKQELPSLAP